MLEHFMKMFFPQAHEMQSFDPDQYMQGFQGTAGKYEGMPYGMYGDYNTQSPDVSLGSILKQLMRPDAMSMR